MSELPHARFAKQPLLAIAVSLAAGILLSNYLKDPKLAVALMIAGFTSLGFATRVRGRVALIAVAALLFSFGCAGYLLAFVETRTVSADRIVRLFERGELKPNDPVELTGRVWGGP